MHSRGPDIACGSCALLASVFLLLVSVGCEPKVRRVGVSGQVLIDGKPLTKGTIRFVPESGRPAGSLISMDGSFRVVSKSATDRSEVVGLVPGKYLIAVSATETLSEAEDTEVRWLVPRHYGHFRTSGLEVDIQEPTDSLIVELSWEGAPEMDTETSIETDAETGPEKSSSLEEDRETLVE